MYLGEFLKGSEIFLELNIKNNKNKYIEPDENPFAEIYKVGFKTEEKIKEIELQKKEEGLYSSYYEIPRNTDFGEYLIKYNAKIKGKIIETKERFKIRDTEEKLKKIQNDLRGLYYFFGARKDEENIFDYLNKIYNELKEKKEEKISLTNFNLLTQEGYNTTFILDGKPLKNGRIIANDLKKEEAVEYVFSDEEGNWSMEIPKGNYRFDFMLPNGKIVKKITRVV
jgi:hypothetical protein